MFRNTTLYQEKPPSLSLGLRVEAVAGFRRRRRVLRRRARDLDAEELRGYAALPLGGAAAAFSLGIFAERAPERHLSALSEPHLSGPERHLSALSEPHLSGSERHLSGSDDWRSAKPVSRMAASGHYFRLAFLARLALLPELKVGLPIRNRTVSPRNSACSAPTAGARTVGPTYVTRMSAGPSTPAVAAGGAACAASASALVAWMTAGAATEVGGRRGGDGGCYLNGHFIWFYKTAISKTRSAGQNGWEGQKGCVLG